MHIAPCGMNCSLCLAYQRDVNSKNSTCSGCLGSNLNKPSYCVRCPIKLCRERKPKKNKYCFSCKIYPCARLKRLDKRYRTRYNMSMIENLDTIREKGIREFTKVQKEKWTCPECGSLICVHRAICLKCDTKQPDR